MSQSQTERLREGALRSVVQDGWHIVFSKWTVFPFSKGKGRASRRLLLETYGCVPNRENVPRRRKNGGLKTRGVFACVNGNRSLYVLVQWVSLTRLPGQMPLGIYV